MFSTHGLFNPHVISQHHVSIPLEITGSLSYAKLPNVDTFYCTTAENLVH